YVGVVEWPVLDEVGLEQRTVESVEGGRLVPPDELSRQQRPPRIWHPRRAAEREARLLALLLDAAVHGRGFGVAGAPPLFQRDPADGDLGVQLVGERRDRHPQGAQQSRPIQADVAPRSEVVGPEKGVHRHLLAQVRPSSMARTWSRVTPRRSAIS